MSHSPSLRPFEQSTSYNTFIKIILIICLPTLLFHLEFDFFKSLRTMFRQIEVLSKFQLILFKTNCVMNYSLFKLQFLL